MKKTTPIYLDYNATTPLTPEVIKAMRPYLEEHFGNPSSNHPYGRITHEAIETARSRIAKSIMAATDEIIFTSSGTESNNLAIRGAFEANVAEGNHIITSAIEHPAVSEVCQYLATQGVQITTLPVNSYGMVSLNDLQAALKSETILVSIMHANNEIGTIQPIKALAELAHQAGALFHTDAAQSIGKIQVNVDDLGVDLLSIAGHKLYAPKGVGALYIRSGTAVEKIQFGAGQERNLRPGTENVLEIVGLGKAADQAERDLEKNMIHFKTLRDRLHAGLETELPTGMIRLNGHPDERLPNTLNLSFYQIEANTLLDTIQKSVAASAGAACHSNTVRISSVIEAMGIPLEWAKGTVRFSVGRMTTREDIDQAITIIVRAVKSFI